MTRITKWQDLGFNLIQKLLSRANKKISAQILLFGHYPENNKISKCQTEILKSFEMTNFNRLGLCKLQIKFLAFVFHSQKLHMSSKTGVNLAQKNVINKTLGCPTVFKLRKWLVTR